MKQAFKDAVDWATNNPSEHDQNYVGKIFSSGKRTFCLVGYGVHKQLGLLGWAEDGYLDVNVNQALRIHLADHWGITLAETNDIFMADNREVLPLCDSIIASYEVQSA